MKAAKDASLRQSQIFENLGDTLDAVELWLVDNHSLMAEEVNALAATSADIREGMRLVLLDRMEAFDDRIPDPNKGGAVIANSANAYHELSATLQKADLESMIGSIDDKETTDHICYQFGFSRDGLQRRV